MKRIFAEKDNLNGTLLLDECINGHLYLCLKNGDGKIDFIVDAKDRKELSKQVKRYRK